MVHIIYRLRPLSKTSKDAIGKLSAWGCSAKIWMDDLTAAIHAITNPVTCAPTYTHLGHKFSPTLTWHVHASPLSHAKGLKRITTTLRCRKRHWKLPRCQLWHHQALGNASLERPPSVPDVRAKFHMANQSQPVHDRFLVYLSLTWGFASERQLLGAWGHATVRNSCAHLHNQPRSVAKPEQPPPHHNAHYMTTANAHIDCWRKFM